MSAVTKILTIQRQTFLLLKTTTYIAKTTIMLQWHVMYTYRIRMKMHTVQSNTIAVINDSDVNIYRMGDDQIAK